MFHVPYFYSMSNYSPRRIRALEFVNSVKAKLTCERCGDAPVEFHSETHDKNPENRVCALVVAGRSIERIKREIAICQALCRRCHMLADGRLERFKQNGFRTPGDFPKPCSRCARLYKPLRRGMCAACYDKVMYRPNVKDPDLSRLIVGEILAMASEGVQYKEIARIFKVDPSTVSRRVRGLTTRKNR